MHKESRCSSGSTWRSRSRTGRGTGTGSGPPSARGRARWWPRRSCGRSCVLLTGKHCALSSTRVTCCQGRAVWCWLARAGCRVSLRPRPQSSARLLSPGTQRRVTYQSHLFPLLSTAHLGDLPVEAAPLHHLPGAPAQRPVGGLRGGRGWVIVL